MERFVLQQLCVFSAGLKVVVEHECDLSQEISLWDKKRCEIPTSDRLIQQLVLVHALFI